MDDVHTFLVRSLSFFLSLKNTNTLLSISLTNTHSFSLSLSLSFTNSSQACCCTSQQALAHIRYVGRYTHTKTYIYSSQHIDLGKHAYVHTQTCSNTSINEEKKAMTSRQRKKEREKEREREVWRLLRLGIEFVFVLEINYRQTLQPSKLIICRAFIFYSKKVEADRWNNN